MISYGLIGGLAYRDMQDMTPGEVVDCFLFRREYDDARFGVKRE